MSQYVNPRADPAFAAALQQSRQRRQAFEEDPAVQRRKRQAQMLSTVSALAPLAGAAIGGVGGGVLGGIAGAGAGGVGAIPGAISGAGAGVGAGGAFGQAAGSAGQMLAGNMTQEDDDRRAREQAAMQSAVSLMQLARR